jgi:hypothetical protein
MSLFVIPTDYDLDSILLVKFIQEFRRPGAVTTKHKQLSQDLKLKMKAM